MKTLMTLPLLLAVSACNQTFTDGEPFQSATYKGDPRKMAECVKEELTVDSVNGLSIGRKGEDLYLVSSFDFGTKFWTLAFKPQGGNDVLVETRGVPYVWAAIPPWSEELMGLAKGCSERVLRRKG